MGRYSLEDLEAKYKGQHVIICGNGPSGKTVDFSEYDKSKPIWTFSGGWGYHPESELGWYMDDLHGPDIRVMETRGQLRCSVEDSVGMIGNAMIPVITSTARS